VAEKKPEEKKPATDAKDAAKLLADLEKAADELRGHRFAARGEWADAVKQYERAKSNREVLSRAQAAAGQKEAAEKTARQAATADKNQAYPRANLVDVLQRIGKDDEAGKEFAELRRVGGEMDLNLPVVKRLQPVIEREKIAGDWRIKPTWSDDTAKRPELDSLGPVRWSPSAAPKLGELVNAEGKRVRWDDYRGRPVVLVFYLGRSCLHCVEQLKKLAPEAGKFREAGIELLGVSTDTPDALQTSWTSFSSDGTFPFPLTSDAELKNFRAYGAYDDFERQPLHATVLVDGQGRILWQDIGAEPFNDVKFLLGEARRQLSFARP
jgi:peroxiredoxin